MTQKAWNNEALVIARYNTNDLGGRGDMADFIALGLTGFCEVGKLQGFSNSGMALFKVKYNDPQALINLSNDPAVHIVDEAKWAQGNFDDAAQFSIDNGVVLQDLINDIPMFADAKAKAGLQGIVNKRQQIGV